MYTYIFSVKLFHTEASDLFSILLLANAAIRTHHVEIKGWAFAVALGIISHARVIARAFAIDPLQHQALVTDYNTLRDVVMECLALEEKR